MKRKLADTKNNLDDTSEQLSKKSHELGQMCMEWNEQVTQKRMVEECVTQHSCDGIKNLEVAKKKIQKASMVGKLDWFYQMQKLLNY